MHLRFVPELIAESSCVETDDLLILPNGPAKIIAAINKSVSILYQFKSHQSPDDDVSRLPGNENDFRLEDWSSMRERKGDK